MRQRSWLRECNIVGQIGLDFFRPPLDLGFTLSDGLGECSGAVKRAPSKGGRGHKAGAPTACIDNACALDAEAGFLESGVELFGC